VGSIDSVDAGLSPAACKTVIGSPSVATPTMEMVTFPSAERARASPLVDTVIAKPGPDVSSAGRFVATLRDTTPIVMHDGHIPSSPMAFA
jgi:hypothetical protein